MLSRNQISEYQTNGVLKIKLDNEIISLTRAFLQELSLYLDHYFGSSFREQPVEKRLHSLAKESRSEIGKLYQVIRRFPSMKKLACHDWFIAIAQDLMDSKLVSCCNFVAARFDFPGESKYATAPHQDFPYIQGSPDALTFWLPFVDVPFTTGAPSYVPASHRDGPQPVIEREIDNSNGTASIEASELEVWSRLDYQKIEVMEDECLVFSTNLIHKSEPNLSDYCRITTQLRFDNLINQTSWEKGFPEGLYLGQKFSSSYPELVKVIS